MAETCYSQGKKILLMPEQQPNGTWRCRFAIPGLLESTIGTSVDAPLGRYKSEWDAKTAAFALPGIHCFWEKEMRLAMSRPVALCSR